MRRGLLTTAAVLAAGSCSAVAQAHPVITTPQAWSIGGAPFAALQDPPPTVPHFDPGHALREPPVLRSSKRRLKQTLVARNGTILVSGVELDAAQTYGVGSTPRGLLGPTLHVQPGDTIDLVLDNRLVQLPEIPAPTPTPTPPMSAAPHGGDCAHDTKIPAGHPQPTNLHFHGMHVTPRNHKVGGVTYYGDNVLACLGAGRSHIRFKVPADHDQGTFWYHAHLHGLTDDQVFRGLAGMLLVGDSRTGLPKRLRNVKTRLMSLKDVQVVPIGDRWSIPSNHFWSHPTTRTVNGMVLPKVTMRPGETQLWRLANASAAVWYDIAVQDAAKTSRPFTIVARDGNRLVAPQRVAHEPLGPGQRIDVLVRAPRSGPLTLTTLSFQQGQTATFPATDLATVEIAGASARDVASPPRRGKLPEFPAKRGPTRTWRFSYVVNNKIPTFFINDQPFSPTRVDAKPRLGTTERWVFVNESTEWHPIHVHQDDFRVLSVNGKRVSARSDQDVVALPPMRGTKKGTVEIDMPFVKYSGNFVLHCHILDHEDGGMMARINVRE